MHETKLKAAEITADYVLKDPDIARIGRPTDTKDKHGKTVYYYEWMTEGVMAEHFLEDSKFCDRFYRHITPCSTGSRSYKVEVRFKDIDGDSITVEDVTMELLRAISSEYWQYNLKSIQNAAKIIFMWLSYPWEDEEGLETAEEK